MDKHKKCTKKSISGIYQCSICFDNSQRCDPTKPYHGPPPENYFGFANNNKRSNDNNGECKDDNDITITWYGGALHLTQLFFI